jgi:hypothetical protein
MSKKGKIQPGEPWQCFCLQARGVGPVSHSRHLRDAHGQTRAYMNVGNSGHKSGWRLASSARYRSKFGKDKPKGTKVD